MFRVTRKRPNPRRWLYRFGFAALAVAIGLLIVRSVVLPRIIRGKVNAALRQLGVSSPEFELRDAGLWGTELRNLSEGGAGDSPIRIGAVSIAYGPIDATSGKIESVTLRGAELFASLKEGKLDLGPFSRRPSSSGGGSGNLPFKRIRLESSTLHLDWEGQAWWLPVSGTLTNDGAGRLTLDAQTFAAASTVTVRGTIDPVTDQTTLDIDAPTVNLATLVSTIPQRRLPMDIHAGGRSSLHVTYRDAAGKREANVKIEPHEAWVSALVGEKQVQADGVTLIGDASVDVETGRLTSVALEGKLASISADGQAVRDVTLSVRPHDDVLSFSLAAAGEHWRLIRLEGDTRVLIAEPGEATEGPATPLSFTASYQLAAALPPAAQEALKVRGVDASRVGEIEAEGDVSGFAHLGSPPAGRDAWQVKTDATQLSLAPADLIVGNGGATVRALAASLKLRGTVNPREAVASLLDDCWIDCQAIVQDDPAAKPLLGGDARVMLLPADDNRPALRVCFGTDGPDLAAALHLRTDAPVALSSGGADFHVNTIDWNGRIVSPAKGKASVAGTLALLGGSASHAASKTLVGGIELSLPISINAEAVKPGAFTIGELKVDGRSMPPVKGSAAVNGAGATFDAAWSPLAGADVTAKGSLDWSDARHVFGEADVTLKPLKLTDPAALGSAVPAIANWNVTGTLGATGHVALRYGNLRPSVTVTVDDVAAHDGGKTFSVEGLTGSVTFDTLSPPTTPGQQRLTATKLTTGKLALVDGAVELRVESPRSILIEQTNWGWAGGRVYSHAFRIDPQRPDVDVVLYADGLRVSDMLALVADNRATGEGEMFGRVPLVVRWPKITFGDGFLYTRPGATGELKFLDSDTAGNLLDQSDPRFKSDKNFALVKQRVVDALRDFQYDRLGLELQNDQERPGALTARLKVHGKGRTGPKPQELDLTFNFTGVDEVLNAYVGFQQWMSRLGQ